VFTKSQDKWSALPAPACSHLIVLGCLFACLSSCGGPKGAPDVSGVTVKNVLVERFDTAWFAMDSDHIAQDLYRVSREYPWFIGDFVTNILGAGPLADTNRVAFAASRAFLVSYHPVEDSIRIKYRDMAWLGKELTQAFRFVKYYFPRYPLPEHVVAYIGPFDGPGVAITPSTLAIGLQLFAGQHSSFYTVGKGQDDFPAYIARRFEPAFIPAGCLSVVAEDLFPDSSDNKTLIEQMIGKGKYWWLVDKFLPETPDSIKTGYTQDQLEWCNANEGLIWSYFLQNTDLFTVDPDLIKNYIGESPKTLGMPDASPGNIGAWVGWQIVKKYVNGHGGITPEQLMRVPARKIFEEGKYKPK
jgi:hypothetical protein